MDAAPELLDAIDQASEAARPSATGVPCPGLRRMQPGLEPSPTIAQLLPGEIEIDADFVAQRLERATSIDPPGMSAERLATKRHAAP